MIQPMETGVLGSKHKWRGVGIIAARRREEIVIIVRNEEADEEETKDVEPVQGNMCVSFVL